MVKKIAALVGFVSLFGSTAYATTISGAGAHFQHLFMENGPIPIATRRVLLSIISPSVPVAVLSKLKPLPLILGHLTSL